MPIEIYQADSPAASYPPGATRSVWFSSKPAANGFSPQFNYMNIRAGGQSQSDFGAGGGFGATISIRQWDPAIGVYGLNRTNGANQGARLIQVSALFVPAALNLLSRGNPNPDWAVWIFRESIETGTTVAPAAGRSVFHGWYLGFNTSLNVGFGGTIQSGTVFRGLGLIRGALGTYAAYARQSTGAAAQITPLAIDLATPATVEHRLYQPTRTAYGRYELRVNDILLYSINGDDANFPNMAREDEGFMPCPLASDTGTAAEWRVWASELIAGRDDPATL